MGKYFKVRNNPSVIVNFEEVPDDWDRNVLFVTIPEKTQCFGENEPSLSMTIYGYVNNGLVKEYFGHKGWREMLEYAKQKRDRMVKVLESNEAENDE